MTKSTWSGADQGYNIALLVGLGVGALVYLAMFIRHLLSWSRPYMNVAYLRIYLLALVYLTLAVASFLDTSSEPWTSIFRSWYEAYAFYVFCAMLMAAHGGEEAMEKLWEQQAQDPDFKKKRFIPGRHCGMTRARWVHVALFQFQIVQPLTALIVALLDHNGRTTRASTVILRIIGIASLVIAMRTLLQVYQTVGTYVSHMGAIRKVAWFKMLVAFVVLQEAIFNVLGNYNVFHATDDYTHEDVEIRIVSGIIALESFLWLLLGWFLFSPSDQGLQSASNQPTPLIEGESGVCGRFGAFLALWTACGPWKEQYTFEEAGSNSTNGGATAMESPA